MEIFKTIDGYDNYKISNYGNVINDNTNKILKPYKNSLGYSKVVLSKNRKKTDFNIHRLVALYFCENENNYDMVDHIDRDPSNNCYNNLRWVNNSQNNRNKNKKQNTSSKYIGVSFHIKNNNWTSQIKFNYKKKHLGSFATEEEAYEAFKNEVIEHNLQEFYPDL